MEKNLENKKAALRAIDEFYKNYLLGNNTLRDESMKEDMFRLMELVAHI